MVWEMTWEESYVAAPVNPNADAKTTSLCVQKATDDE
jgi:hypothetical protein